MANNENLKPFKKGYDPRRNLKGVPRDAIEARKLIRKIGSELVHVKEKIYDPEVGGYIDVEYDIDRYSAMIRLMYSSRNPAEKIALLKALSPGLLKDEVDVTSGGKALNWKDFISDNTCADNKQSD